MENLSAGHSHDGIRHLIRPWRWLFHERTNGLQDDTWVPVLLVDRRIVTALLDDLRSTGVPARCTRFRPGWHIPPWPATWCVWVSRSAYPRAQERLAVTVPRLIRAMNQGPIGLAGSR
jgi:hypothetical protein